MYVDDQKWNDIIAETKAGIDRWNDDAAKYGVNHVFRVHLQNSDTYSLIVTEHASDYHEWKVLARELKTSEVRSTKPIIKRGRFVGFKTRTPDPKIWSTLADKPAKTIVGKTKLVNFFIIIGSRMTGTVSA